MNKPKKYRFITRAGIAREASKIITDLRPAQLELVDLALEKVRAECLKKGFIVPYGFGRLQIIISDRTFNCNPWDKRKGFSKKLIKNYARIKINRNKTFLREVSEARTRKENANT